ncbi:MAG: NusA-like transcription termination signal-binding factor [Methanosarcinales archaeon]|nr:NusA-like transcription termination signal-binding factor [Methanosarcinales archaeon]
MSEVKINTDGIRYIALFENVTGATAMDCLVDDDNNRVIFVVKSGDMGIAIGKNGEHINRVVKNVGRHVEVVEYSDEPEKFIKDLLQPANASSVKIGYKGDRRIAYVEVSIKEKGLAIGRNGRNIEKVKLLAKRHHDIDDVTIQ